MFDFGWIELVIIGLVVVLVLGPKELPHAMRSLAKFMRKARRMAAEFQGHFDDMLRETELDDVKKQVDQLRRTNISAEIEKTIDPGGELKRDYNDAIAKADAPAGAKPSASGQKAVGKGGAAHTEAAVQGEDAPTPAPDPGTPSNTAAGTGPGTGRDAEAGAASAKPAEPEPEQSDSASARPASAGTSSS